MNYLIATIRPWNLELYQRHFSRNRQFSLITKKEDLTLSKLKKKNPRYIFFPHWSWIIPREVWENFECVVFHMTDLPYGRGGSPLQNLIVRGKKKTKISALRVEEGMDTGDIYLKKSLSLQGSAEEIYKRGSKIVFRGMIPYIVSQEPKPKPQSGPITVFERRKPEQSKIESGWSLDKIYDHIRMLDAPEYPKAFIEIDDNRVEFSQVRFDKKRKILKTKAEFYVKSNK